MFIHSFWAVQLFLLIADKLPVAVFAEYSNFANVFLSKSATKLLKYTKIDNYLIRLMDDQQLPYGPIYSLGPVEL